MGVSLRELSGDAPAREEAIAIVLDAIEPLMTVGHVKNARLRAQQAAAAIAQGQCWGPLHGVPITIKDFYETRGVRTTAGYAPLRNYIPEQDATLVERLRQAGAVLLGKTNPSDVNGTYQGVNDLFPLNLSGHPAVVIPISYTQAGLPIGLQIVGHRWREMELLAIAQQIDEVVGNFQSPPGYQ